MNIIVTGASGFIGTDMIRQLCESKHNIIAMGRNFPMKNQRVIYYEQDLLSVNVNNIKSILPGEKADVIIHAAGQAHIPSNRRNEQLFIRNNIKATQSMINLAIETNVRKCIFISTVAVIEHNIENDFYAYTKKQAEDLIIDFCRRKAMQYTIIRPVVVYGENDVKGNMYKLIRQIRRGIFPLVNKGNTVKNIIYIRNLSKLITDIVDSDECRNKILIAKDKEDLTIGEICQLIDRVLSGKCFFMNIPTYLLNMFIHFIKYAQLLGVFKGLNVSSIKRLKMNTHYHLSSYNKLFIANLPYSSAEGLCRTVCWVKEHG